MTEDRYVASMLALALADAAGAKYEGGFVGGLVWKMVGGDKGGLLRWTDDTQMAMGLAESLVERGGLDPDHLAKRWADTMEWRRGYGPGARKLLKRIAGGENWRSANRSVFPDGSFGNGAAMRAAPIGSFYHGDREALLEAAVQASTITHAHPLGIEGGKLIAWATALALDDTFEPEAFLESLLQVCEQEPFLERLEIARQFLEGPPSVRETRARLGCSIVAHESAVTACYAFARFHDDFEAMIRFIIEIGGDTDTIGAMAGGCFGALHGTAALPPSMLARLEEREKLEELGGAIFLSPERPEKGGT